MRYLFMLLITAGCFAKNLQPLYHSLNPCSIREQLSFHALYPDSEEGRQAYERAFALMTKHAPKKTLPGLPSKLPEISIPHLLSLTHTYPEEQSDTLDAEDCAFISELCRFLPNRALKGSSLQDPDALDTLPSEEIDVARALLLLEYQNHPDRETKIARYEASLDFMALEILARLPVDATDAEKIAAINSYIFHELKFRFPPHSLWAKDIDEYTLLPSVMDSRRGVCLGVSILYLSLAQRLELSLEIVTPPGHIYLKHKAGCVIETTARGIDLPEDTYLSINTKALQHRSVKEVLGLAFFNQASVAWKKSAYEEARQKYKTARRFMPNDPLLEELYGFARILTGDADGGRKCLRRALELGNSYEIYSQSIAHDVLEGRLHEEGLKALFREVDHTRHSILTKRDELITLLKQSPQSQELLFHLAICYLQLGRGKEASDTLSRYLTLNSGNPTAYYYLAILSLERYNYTSARHYLRACEQITESHGHKPKALLRLQNELRKHSPEPRKHFT